MSEAAGNPASVCRAAAGLPPAAARDSRHGRRMTTMTSGSTDLAQFVACIADIARTLEAPHEAQTRLRHVLGLVRGVIPCDRCALHVPALGEQATITMPDVAAGDAARLDAFLRDILQFME